MLHLIKSSFIRHVRLPSAPVCLEKIKYNIRDYTGINYEALGLTQSSNNRQRADSLVNSLLGPALWSCEWVRGGNGRVLWSRCSSPFAGEAHKQERSLMERLQPFTTYGTPHVWVVLQRRIHLNCTRLRKLPTSRPLLKLGTKKWGEDGFFSDAFSAAALWMSSKSKYFFNVNQKI